MELKCSAGTVSEEKQNKKRPCFLIALLSTKTLFLCFALLRTADGQGNEEPDNTAPKWEFITAVKPRGTLPTLTVPARPYKVEGCDNLAAYCLKGYTWNGSHIVANSKFQQFFGHCSQTSTGRVCGRHPVSLNQLPKYQDFKNICELDFMNCSEGFEVWKIAHMGSCLRRGKQFNTMTYLEWYEYMDDGFLNYNYAIRE